MRRTLEGLAAVTSLVVGAIVLPAASTAQQPATPVTQGRVAVFLDCQSFCDGNYVRTEIKFVDWARDRADADVHLLVTSQETGGGGQEYTLAFIGLRRFAGTSDTLYFTTRNTDVQDEIRAAQVRTIKLGLIHFAASSPAAPHLTVTYEAPADSSSKATAHDPWNYWVFQVSVGGSANGEQSSKSSSFRGSVSANRVTEDWKVELGANGRRNRSEFALTDSTYVNVTHNYGTNALIVRSLGSHWSAGVRANASSSTRTNQRLSVSGGPALEFDFYPYAQSTRQQVTLQYSIARVQYEYEDTTIFNVTSEGRFQERLQLAAGITQPWGSINASIEGSHFLDNWSQHSVNVFGGTSLRVFRGLNFNVFGEFSRIKDQIYLPKAGASDQDILLQQRQLGTDYSYFVNFSFSYRFGSKFNNVVNPRFNGGGGFFFFD